jgi:3-methyl-2-oxobutanoate hydroxymethyltransferase
MSTHSSLQRLTAPAIRARKGKEPIVALTSYHAGLTAIADDLVDIFLVGDSLGMVLYGLETTVPVSMEMMIAHGQAVVRGSKRALVVVDMPFGAYEASPQEAFHNASHLLKKTGAGAVKLEGGYHMAPTIQFLVERGIPVMAHIGLMPQAVHTLGGFKAQGRDVDEWAAIERDAQAVSEAGAFAVVLEGIVEPLAAKLTAAIRAPTIGIGASSACNGQILVMDDMLGLTANVPKFVRKFVNLREQIHTAIMSYAQAVKAREFPSKEHVYDVRKSVE